VFVFFSTKRKATNPIHILKPSLLSPSTEMDLGLKIVFKRSKTLDLVASVNQLSSIPKTNHKGKITRDSTTKMLSYS
jgi:hypothetical protein